jgi:hypothetical protein
MEGRKILQIAKICELRFKPNVVNMLHKKQLTTRELCDDCTPKQIFEEITIQLLHFRLQNNLEIREDMTPHNISVT